MNLGHNEEFILNDKERFLTFPDLDYRNLLGINYLSKPFSGLTLKVYLHVYLQQSSFSKKKQPCVKFHFLILLRLCCKINSVLDVFLYVVIRRMKFQISTCYLSVLQLLKQNLHSLSNPRTSTMMINKHKVFLYNRH